jgi:integrating conjugative element protein (TIGR03752 family)
VRSQVREDLRREAGNAMDATYTQLLNRFEALEKQLAGQETRVEPVAIDSGVQPLAETGLVWIEPLGGSGLRILEKASGLASAAGQKASEAVAGAGSLLHGAGDSIADNPLLEHAGLGNAGNDNNSPPFPPEPAYTVPRNATLIGSTGMTALIGRIPVKGQVEDPYPFKVIVGADNLAANGLSISGVDGMIFSGTATGDWALSCVRGQLLSVTFVFVDGTIRTLSADDQSLQQKSQQSAQAQGQQTNTNGNNRPLGWISDRRGIPCVSGERITNAASYLSGRVLARAIGAAGQAFARSQTTVTTSPLTGGFTSGITGDAAQYAAGQTAAGGADEVANWLMERQSQSFDVVFVDTGVELAIHIDQELPIDFEPRGRKLAYARSSADIRDQRGLD